MVLRIGIVALSVFLTMRCGLPVVDASDGQPTASATDEAAAIEQFEKAIAKYITLRRSIRGQVAGPVMNSTGSQVTDSSDALAAAIRRARKNAAVGSIFNRPISAIIKRRIADTVRSAELVPVLAGIDDENKVGPTPKLHLRLPVSAQIATMPPSLLAVLPPLPKELEYRIMGRHLVLRDVDASIIIDYIPRIVPRQ